MSRSLLKLASLRVQTLIQDWIADLTGARTSIINQEISGSDIGSLTIDTWAMSQYQTLWAIHLQCDWPLMLCQQRLQLCYQ